MELFKLWGSVLVDSTEADKSIAKTDKKAGGLGTTLGKGIKTAAKFGAALGAGALVAGGAIFALGVKLGNTADELLDLNSITGMSTDNIQKWRKVTEVAGVATDAMTNASKKLTKSLDTMGEEGNKGNEALGKLGLSLEEIESMSADERMNTLTEALAGVDDKTERARIGTDLFGNSWEEIAPVVDLGTEAMNKAKDSANIISEEDLKKANDFRIKVADMKEQLSFFVTKITIAVMPTLSKMMNWVQDKMPVIKETIREAFSLIVDKGKEITTIVMEIVTDIFPKFTGSSDGMKTTLKDLTEKGLNLVILALTWIRDYMPIIKAGVVALTAVWAIQTGIILSNNVALLAHNAQMLYKKSLDLIVTVQIKALYAAQYIQTAATWLGHAAMTAFNFVMSMNPIALVIIGLAALGVAIYQVIKHWKDIVTWVEKAWDWLNKWNGTEAKNKTVTTTQKTVYSSSGKQSGNAQFAVGTRYLPADMVIQAHEGEMIVPKSENPYANSSGKIIESPSNNQEITINTPVYLDGKKITTVTSRVQLQSNKSKARALGVVTA